MSGYIECPCKVVTIVGPLAERRGGGYHLLENELAICTGCGANWIHLSAGCGRWVKNTELEFSEILNPKPQAAEVPR